MAKLINEIAVNLPGETRELRFETTEDLVRWAAAEEPFWTSHLNDMPSHHIGQHWRQQISFYSNVISYAKQYDEFTKNNQENEARGANKNLRMHFKQLSDGNIITSDHDFFPAIVDLAKFSPALAGLVLAAARGDADSTLGNFGPYGTSFSSLIQLILQYGRSEGTKDWLQPQREELTQLKDEFKRDLDEVRSSLKGQNDAISLQRASEAQAHAERNNQWDALKERLDSDWSALKRVYDEQLALLAPTQYWADRVTSHKAAATRFAISFGLLLSIFTILFASLAMPHLLEVSTKKDVSPMLALVPIATLAFAGVWVLKMLSRLLSENLQMMRDSKERETMIKTFLALMRDDKNGKSIVNDNDRILILHSLFRPSSINAVDDAPPVHWFDILTNKVSGKSAPKT